MDLSRIMAAEEEKLYLQMGGIISPLLTGKTRREEKDHIMLSIPMTLIWYIQRAFMELFQEPIIISPTPLKEWVVTEISCQYISPSTNKNIVPKAEEGEPPLRGQWLAAFILSPHDSKTIYHGMQYLFKSSDQGDTWERISPDLTHNNPDHLGDVKHQTITAVSESPLKKGLLYVGTDDGRVWISNDDGGQWNEIVEGIAPDRWISRIEASRFDEGTVYMVRMEKEMMTLLYMPGDLTTMVKHGKISQIIFLSVQ